MIDRNRPISTDYLSGSIPWWVILSFFVFASAKSSSRPGERAGDSADLVSSLSYPAAREHAFLIVKTAPQPVIG